MANLIEHEWLAHVGVALELGIVLFQALTAVWFYRLFRGVDAFSAGSLAAFGMVNAVAIMASAALLATALEVADDASLAVRAVRLPPSNCCTSSAASLWGVAATFFGLWLIPMGWLVIRSRWMRQPLGWILIVGGVGYLVSAFVSYLFPNADLVAGLLSGHPRDHRRDWIIGYLIIVGVRDHVPAPEAIEGGLRTP